MHKLLSIVIVVAATLLVNDCGAQRRRPSRPAAKPLRIIQLEVSSSARAEITTQQRWMEMLSQVGADNVRSLTSPLVSGPEVKEIQSSRATTIKVKGVIQGSKLHLPGKSFSIRDAGSIRQYLAALRAEGTETALAEKQAFGLTAEQLVEVHTALSSTLEKSTLGMPTSDVVGDMLKKVGIELVLTPASRELMRNDSPINEELKGLSLGTSLAAAMRPAGMVLSVERKQGGSPRLLIAKHNQVAEFWPVGWPNDANISDVHPKLMERQPLEIRNFSLAKVLKAIEKRAELPFLYDRNSLALAGVDIDTTKVTLVNKKIAYLNAVQKMLSQTKPRLRAELRVDDDDKPFLWISTFNNR